MKMTIKINYSELPNELHFETQKKFRALVQKTKKGKGSYSRKEKYGAQY